MWQLQALRVYFLAGKDVVETSYVSTFRYVLVHSLATTWSTGRYRDMYRQGHYLKKVLPGRYHRVVVAHGKVRIHSVPVSSRR